VNPAIAPTRAERDQVVDRLREAVSEGILAQDEFEERLDAVFAADTRAGLDSLVANLPQSGNAPERLTTPQRRGLVAVAAVAILGLTAFAVMKPEASSSSQLSSARNVDSCTLVSTAQIESVTGTGIVGPPARHQSSQGWGECSYPTASGGPAVTVQAGTALSQFTTRDKSATRDVHGLGSQAAVAFSSSGTTILARQGSDWVEVAVRYLPSRQEAMDDAETLARSALDRLTGTGG
jgi:Domain of unknown function (DUF1707)